MNTVGLRFQNYLSTALPPFPLISETQRSQHCPAAAIFQRHANHRIRGSKKVQ